MNELYLNRSLQREVFNRLIGFEMYIGDIYGTCFCPFHADKRHKSAKVFRDIDILRIYCFACQRQFTAYDYCKRLTEYEPVQFLLTKFKKDKILHEIEQVKQGYLSSMNNNLEQKTIENKAYYFIKKQGSLPAFIESLYTSLEEVNE